MIGSDAAKPKRSANEVGRSKLFWIEFTKAVGVNAIGELGHAHIVQYEAAIVGTGLSSKMTHHRYVKIKTIIAYALKRGLDTEGCRRALDAAALLDAGNRIENDPQPIETRIFRKIHAAAMKSGDKVFAALMLTALNFAPYGGEVAALKWSEVDLRPA